jgi:hypothetical protein
MTFTLAQVLRLVGALDDAPGTNTPRERFRAFLLENVRSAGQLRDFVQECRVSTDPQHSRALQDLVNHAGTLLGFNVRFGRYAGVAGQIGHDGLWSSPLDPMHVVVEVKTSETYPIRVPTLLDYINRLIDEGAIHSSGDALGLFVIARPDPEVHQVHNAIVAQGHGNRLRLTSVESLITLADLLETQDVQHRDVLHILRPSGPSIDPLIDLLVRLGGAAAPIAPADMAPTAIRMPSLADSEAQLTRSLARRTPVPAAPAAGPSFHLIPVSDTNTETAAECVQRMVQRSGVWAFTERAAGRSQLAVGDHVCFYASGIGVVAHARVSAAPVRQAHPAVDAPEEFPWTVGLSDARLYTESPVAIDADRRASLEAFAVASEPARQNWSWFVQSTHRLYESDFQRITRQS